MSDYLKRLGIDELRKQLAIADRHDEYDLIELIQKELATRDIEGYEQRQAEAGFGA